MRIECFLTYISLDLLHETPTQKTKQPTPLFSEDLNSKVHGLLSPYDIGRNWEYQYAAEDMKKLKYCFEKFIALPSSKGGKQLISLLTVAGGMGTGKSRTLTELPRLLKEFFPEYFEEHRLIVVNVSYEGGTAVREDELEEDAGTSVGVRMLWQLYGEAARSGLNFDGFITSWKASVHDVASEIHKTAGNNPLILLLVDGIHNIDQEVDAYPKSRMQTVLHTLSSAMLSDEYNLFPVVSATVSGPVREAMKNSATVSGVLMHPPRLRRMPEGINQDAETVMSLTLGHPRAIEAVAEVEKFHCSFKDLCLFACDKLSVRYRMSRAEITVPHLLSMCFKKLSEEEERDLDSEVSYGLMTLNDRRLEIAPLWLALQSILQSSTLKDWDWTASVENQAFKKFVAQHLAIRSHVLPAGETCLNDMHYGVDWVSNGDMKYTNTPLEVVESSKKITSASNAKAGLIGGENGNWSINTGRRYVGSLTTNMCVVNGKGAQSADVFYRLGEDQTLSVSCKLQKSAGPVETLSTAELKKNTPASVSPRDVHLIITNKKLPATWKETLTACNPEATYGVVHSGNYKSYFGPFAPFWTAHTGGLPTNTLLRHRAFMVRRLCRVL